jgi:hypothetical protein
MFAEKEHKKLHEFQKKLLTAILTACTELFD